MKTFDEHDDKVWSLEVSSDEKQLLTGAGDSTFILWKDVTEEELAVERQKTDRNTERLVFGSLLYHCIFRVILAFTGVFFIQKSSITPYDVFTLLLQGAGASELATKERFPKGF